MEFLGDSRELGCVASASAAAAAALLPAKMSKAVDDPVFDNFAPYVKDVEVDTDTDEVPASTPPTRPRADDEPRGARAPRKRKWDGEADQSQREVPIAPVRRWANHEPASQSKQKACKLVLPASSVDTGRAADTRNSPSSE
ncbi:hypothetical protein AXG93_3096s1310 [Marchantia polymorpha subsp. ruderalis]|uniref:Uncharacterized protein n=1 Tax=Marchantia polymorpha subsp. ruderalis TaxID=1480154 RepID=A0A176W6Y7_MARPO|nr:hypothetical protein AXG93_3096s1310 [Marchantia polymorpha subsp. ruderalis]